MPFPTIFCIWWYKKRTSTNSMTDFKIDLDGWLERATFRCTENQEYNLDWDDLLLNDINAKADNEVIPDSPLQDFGWLDENIDLSILDHPKNFAITSQNSWILEDTANLLEDLAASGLDISFLPSAESSNNLPDVSDLLELQYEISSPSSSQIYESISEPSSPVSLPSDVSASESLSNNVIVEVCQSPSSMSSCSDSDVESSTVSNVVCDDPDYDPSDELMSFEDITRSVKNRKFVSNPGGKIPKVTLKNNFHPYSRMPSSRSTNSDRKKRQNKEAAARYRIKKRLQDKEQSGVVEGLEEEQRKLQQQHDDLQSEIKYLKKLMCEILEKKGVLK